MEIIDKSNQDQKPDLDTKSNLNQNLCLICRNDITESESEQIQLDCKCKNSYYHFDCMRDWIITKKSNITCLNCFEPIKSALIDKLIDDKQTLGFDYINVFGYKLEFNYLTKYLLTVTFYHFLVAALHDKQDEYENYAFSLSVFHIALMKAHIKTVFCFIQTQIIDSKPKLFIKTKYQDTYKKYEKYINLYFSLVFLLSFAVNLTIYNLNSICGKGYIFIWTMTTFIFFFTIVKL